MNQPNHLQLDALIFAPHPDDAEIGMGGTIAKLIAQGKRVGIVDLTRGEMGTKGTADIRAEEAQKASDALGLHFRANADLGDGNILDTQENRLKIIDLIRQTRASYLFITPPFDRHPDHKGAAELISSAFFQARMPKIKTAHPAFSPKRLFHYFIHDTREIRFTVDITDVFEIKMKSLQAYQSQFINPQLPDDYRYAGLQSYLQQAEALNQYLGSLTGVKYAEGFYCPSPVMVDSPLDLE